ncbi:MAG TPA: hypothetical protein VK821_01850 [Dehalococcoidia bacterium]|nr:hypothetical protein [Dehalococcoidia bacterium]
MLCPWCLHYGAEDEEYLFDAELYCGLCAQQMPRDQAQWTAAFRAMDPEMLSRVEEELNRIAVSKSGLQRDLLDSMGDGLQALAELRASGIDRKMTRPEPEYVRWVEFACTYYAPRLR